MISMSWKLMESYGRSKGKCPLVHPLTQGQMSTRHVIGMTWGETTGRQILSRRRGPSEPIRVSDWSNPNSSESVSARRQTSTFCCPTRLASSLPPSQGQASESATSQPLRAFLSLNSQTSLCRRRQLRRRQEVCRISLRKRSTCMTLNTQHGLVPRTFTSTPRSHKMK